MSEEVKYFRNRASNAVRISDFNFAGRDERGDVAMIPVSRLSEPKIAPSIGTLLEEIDFETYTERVVANSGTYRLGDYELPEVITVVEDRLTGDVKEIKQKVTIEGHQLQSGAVRPEIPHNLYQGAAMATGSRPDPAQGGKTLTELRQNQ